MKNINFVKGVLTVLLVQLVSTSMLFAIEPNGAVSNNTRGLPIDDVEVTLRFTEQTADSVKVNWDPVATVTNYYIFIDGAFIDLGSATEYVISRPTPGPFTVKVEAWKIGGTDELVAESDVVQAMTAMKAPGYAISWDETNPISTHLKAADEIIAAGSDFTVEFWVKAEAIETGIFNISTLGGFSMKIEDDGDLLIFDGADLVTPVAIATGIIDLKDPSNPPTRAVPTPPIHIRDENQSSWQHIAIVFQNTVGYTVYKDGAVFESLTPSTVPNSSWNDLKIENIKGQLDEFRVWSVARTESQIKSFAFSTVDTSLSPGLELYYRFDQPAGASDAIDLTGNGYDSDIDKGAVAEVVVPSYAMVRPVALGAYTNDDGKVAVYWKDSNIQPVVPRVDPTHAIYTVYVTEVEGDYSSLVTGGPFIVQSSPGAEVLSYAFDPADLDPTKTYYMKIAMEDTLSYSPADFSAVQSSYSAEVKYDPAVVAPVASYEGPINSVVFDNPSMYAIVTDSFASSLGTADFTIETWFKASQNSGVLLSSKESLSSSSVGWDISLAGGVPVLNMSDGTTQITVPAGNTPVELNRWNHIAFVRKDGVVTPYLNTEALNSTNSNLDLSWPGGLSFGNYITYDPAKAFIGELDEVRVFNASRSASEIRNHAVLPAFLDITDPTFSLIAYYKCNRVALYELKDELGANATVFGDYLNSRSQSEAMGCPMVKGASSEAASSFEANWSKPTVIIPDAIHYSVETSNGPQFTTVGGLYSNEVTEDDFDVEQLEISSLPFSQSAYFYKVSAVYNFGDINGDGVVDENDYIKRFSKTTALQLDLPSPVPGKCYARSGTSTFTSAGISDLHEANGTALTTSIWFMPGKTPYGPDLKNILRIYDKDTGKTRLAIDLYSDHFKIITDTGEGKSGRLYLEQKRWYALTVVWGADGAIVYLNGDEKYSTTNAKLSTGFTDSELVLESNFDGNLDDLKIWKRKLTVQEIKDYMNFEIENPSEESDLVAYYDFNISRGPFIADLSQHGVNLEVKDSGRFTDSYALGCPNALPFEDVDYNKFTVAWNETVDWQTGSMDPTVQNYDYELEFKSKAKDGGVGTTTVSGVTATADGIDKLNYLVTSLDTSSEELIELNPDSTYYCTVSRTLTNPFTGQVEVRKSREISSKLRSPAPGECLNLLGADDTLTLPDTLPVLGPNFTIETWAKFGPPVAQQFSFEIDAVGVVSRSTSIPTRGFIFNGTDTGVPFLGIDWVIQDADYEAYVQLLFDGIVKDASGVVVKFDLNGNEDPAGSYIKSILPDATEHLLKVESGVVSDSEFGYTKAVTLAGEVHLGFKNSSNESEIVTDGFLLDYDVNLGLDETGSVGGEISGVPSKHARWYNFAMTYDSSTLKLYIDGLETTLSGDPHGTYDLTKKVTTLGEDFNGFIEEFRIWDQVHSPELLKDQRYTELDIEGVDLVDPAEKAEAEARRIERNGLSDEQFGHLLCYLPFSMTQRKSNSTILNVGASAGEATLENGVDYWLVGTLENTLRRTVGEIDGITYSNYLHFPCLRMGYNSRSFDGTATTPDEDATPGLIKSGLLLTDSNTFIPSEFYSYTTVINPHQTTLIDGKNIPTRYLSVMWGLADPSLKSKQVTQQAWFIDSSSLTPSEVQTIPDEDGVPTDYNVPLTYSITFDMKIISPEVYDVNYAGPDTIGMSDAQKQDVRDKFDALSDEDFQLLWRGSGGPIKTSSDVYTDLTAMFTSPSVSPEVPAITVTKVGSGGTRAGSPFTVTFSGVPRSIIIREETATGDVNFTRYAGGFFALGLSVSLNDMILTPVTGLVSGIDVAGNVATIKWSVVTETNVKQYLLEKLGEDGKWITVASLDADGSLTYSLQDPNHVAGDEYRITTIDINGIRQAFAIGSEAGRTAYVTLNSGWNLISMPLANADLSELNDLTLGNYWNWDGQSYQKLEGSPEALEGVWVYSLVNNWPVKIKGIETDQDSLELSSGWNLKGPRENMYFDVDSISVYGWSMDGQYVRISEAISQIVSGHGYWIFNPDEHKVLPFQATPID